MHAGAHPEAEMGRYLTEHGYPNIAPLLGEITRRGADGTPFTLGVAQGFIYNEGDAWSWTQNLLERAVQEVLVLPSGAPLPEQSEAIARFQRAAAMLGRRLGEMHGVLGQPDRRPGVCAAQLQRSRMRRRWAASARGQLDAGLCADRRARAVQRRRSVQPSKCCAQHASARCACRRSWRRPASARWHAHSRRSAPRAGAGGAGGCVLHRFRGRAGAHRSSERRALSSPLRDVAGMLRSFDYAAATIIVAGGAGQDETALARKRSIVERFRQTSSQGIPGRLSGGFGATDAPVERRAQRARSAQSVPDREGRLRDLLRGGQSSGAADTFRCVDWRSSSHIFERQIMAPNNSLALRLVDQDLSIDPAAGGRPRIGSASATRSACWVRSLTAAAVWSCVPTCRRPRRSIWSTRKIGCWPPCSRSSPRDCSQRASAGAPAIGCASAGLAVWCRRPEDPYAFGLLLGELDVYLLAEGNHLELGRCLGAQAMSIEGVDGRALCGLGAERAARVGGRGLQRLGRPAPHDAQARRGRRVGAVHSAPAGRNRLQVRDPRALWAAAAEVRSGGAAGRSRRRAPPR